MKRVLSALLCCILLLLSMGCAPRSTPSLPPASAASVPSLPPSEPVPPSLDALLTQLIQTGGDGNIAGFLAHLEATKGNAGERALVALLLNAREGSVTFGGGLRQIQLLGLDDSPTRSIGQSGAAFAADCNPAPASLALAACAMRATCRAETAEGLISITAAGDCTFGQYPEVAPKYSFAAEFDRQGRNLAFPLAKCTPFFANDTVTVLNCEGTFTESNDMAEKRFRFKGPAAYAQMFANGNVELVNLANNHTYDYKDEGYTDTMAALDATGVAYYGRELIHYAETPDGKVAFIGYEMVNAEPDMTEALARDIATARQKGAVMVVVSFHWGLEYANEANAYQQATARLAVDTGADLVIGHHPHVLQGVEIYKGRTILYSLGNFAFGGDEECKQMETMIFRQSFSLKDGVVTPQTIMLIPCHMSSSGDRNDYQPTPVFGAEGDRIVQWVYDLSAALSDGLRRTP